MADATLKRLIELLGNAPREVRRAAIVIAAEVGNAKETALINALLTAAEDADPDIRLPAIAALGRLRAEVALARLVGYVREGGPELEAAAQAAGCLGAKGARAIEKVMHEVTSPQRRRIAAALAHGDTDSAAVAAAHALLDEDPSVVASAARSLAADVPKLPQGRRKALAAYLTETLGGKGSRKLPPTSEAGMLRVLAALHEPRSEAIFWSRLKPQFPAAVRSTALQALGSLGPPSGEARIKALLECALDNDFQVAAPAMVLLQQVPVNAKTAPRWLPLLTSPEPATRRFGVEKLGPVESPSVAKALVEQLGHADRQLRDLALLTLRQSASGRRALVEAMLEASSPEMAWMLARAANGELAGQLRQRVFDRACSYHEKDDRRADALFFLLRESNPPWVRDQIEARALALRKKKDFIGAVSYFRLLARDPACSEDIRFELAATGLKIANHDLAPEARQAEPSLGQFARLLQDQGFDVLARVRRAKYLDPNDLFYLGFHFTELNGHAREFGGKVLELLVERSPKSSRAKDARRKLKSEGL